MRTDEKAGYDEEHVNADVAAGQASRPQVIQHDSQHGNGAECLDVGPEARPPSRAGAAGGLLAAATMHLRRRVQHRSCSGR
jgi:hypothetical protein